MISKCIAFLALALLLANCCVLGNGCAPATPVAGAPIAWDGLGKPPTDGTEATEPQVRKPARAKREIIIGPLDTAGAGPTSKLQPKDSWEAQQAADQDDEARLKRKLMICQNCGAAGSARDDASVR